MTVTDSTRRRLGASLHPPQDVAVEGIEGETPTLTVAPPEPSRSRQARRRLTIFAVTLTSDATAVAISIVLGYLALTLIGTPRHPVGLPGAFVLLPAYLAGFVVLRGYRQDPQRLLPSIVADLTGTARLLVVGVLVALAEADVLGRIDGRYLRVSEAVAFAVPAVVLVPLSRSAVLHVLSRRREWTPRVIIVGSGQLVNSIVGRLRRSGEAVLVGLVDGDGNRDGLLGGVADLPRLCRLYQVDRVLITPSWGGPDATLKAVQAMDPSVAVSLVPEFYELLNFRSTVEELAGLPLVHVKPASLSVAARVAKRLFDLVAATILIVLLAPLLVTLAILIKRDSSGPVLFRQERPGLRGKPFSIIKFRTMCVDAEARRPEVAPLNEHTDTPLFKVRNDPRLTRIGPHLRERHLDELPQLFNVLLGHMSLVGPRPFPTDMCNNLSPRRVEVRPGMTGLWQVSGRINLSYEDLLYLDTIYVSSWSFWWDIRILLQTPKVLLDRAGDGSLPRTKERRTGDRVENGR